MNQSIVSLKEVDHLANLIKIHLSEKEKQDLSQDLSKIVEFFQKIETLDTENLSPLYNVIEEHRNFFRKDEVSASLDPKKINQITDHFRDGYFIVPKVVE